MKRLNLPPLLALKALFTELPEEKTLTVPNKDALRILGCNKLHSKGVLITLIPQEELLPQWDWWLPAAEQNKAGSPAQNSISTCYRREWENNPPGKDVNALKTLFIRSAKINMGKTTPTLAISGMSEDLILQRNFWSFYTPCRHVQHSKENSCSTWERILLVSHQF